jgi:RND family efflux transporter MFP subunit
MSQKKAVFVGIGIVTLGFVVIFLMLASATKPPKKPVENVSPLVEVLSVELESVTFEVEAHGVVKPRTETTLVSEVSGVIQKVSDDFVAGGYFKQGDVLLRIDPTEYQVSVEQAKARLAGQKAKFLQEEAKAEQARKEWDLTGRSRDKAPILALREPFLLEAKANMQSAEADLKKAQQKLDRTVIRAPYDGMVKLKQADVGQFVATGTQLGATFAVDYAEVRLPLTDKELAFIDIPKWGPSSDLVVPSQVDLVASYAGTEIHWDAQLVRMEGVVNEQSRVHYAVVRISDPYGIYKQNEQQAPLQIGTFVTARIKGKQAQDLYKIPRDAFRDLDSVLISDSANKLYLRDLKIVRAEADYVYVNGGLDQGDRVVLTAIDSPIQGMNLRIAGEPEIEIERTASKGGEPNFLDSDAEPLKPSSSQKAPRIVKQD